MDGGLESQSAGTIPTAGSSASGTAQTTWTVSSSSNSAIREMYDDSTMARTGHMYASSALSASATNVRFQSPSSVAPDTLLTSTDYTVQFFYRATNDPGDDLDGGIYLNNTSGGRTSDITNATPFVSGAWTKAFATRTTNTVFNESNWAVARISVDSAGTYLDTLSYDDFVCYAGAYDSVAPDPVTPPTAASHYTVNGNDANVAWIAPASGVDGGGYVVVKYLSMPAADNDINQNGIYAVGNTTTNGTGSLLGQVVYIGTDTSFTDSYTSGAYYKVYTADKAFNYSDEITLDEEVMISVNDLEDTAIRVYPNPSSEILSISSDNINIRTAAIYTINGQKVLEQSMIGSQSIDVSQLESGIYLLKMEGTDKTYTQKIVVE